MVLHLKKLESLSSKDALCQVWLKLVLGFWRRRFFNFVNVFSLFRNYLPLEKGGALHLNKLESPSPKDALCQVWSKLAQCLWRRFFFYFVNIFSLILCYLLLEKGWAILWGENPGPKKLEFSKLKDALCRVWSKLAKWFWRR